MLSAGLEVAGLRLGGLYDLQKKYYTEKISAQPDLSAA